MNEKLKAKLEQTKAFAKKHGPAVLGAVGTVVATAVAVHFRNESRAWQDELDKRLHNADGWRFLEIPPRTMEDVENGKTLHYRQTGDPRGDRLYVQYSTLLDGFSEGMDELFKSEGGTVETPSKNTEN